MSQCAPVSPTSKNLCGASACHQYTVGTVHSDPEILNKSNNRPQIYCMKVVECSLDAEFDCTHDGEEKNYITAIFRVWGPIFKFGYVCRSLAFLFKLCSKLLHEAGRDLVD